MASVQFEDCFSTDAIVAALCRLRVRRAKPRHDTLFHRRLSDRARKPRHYDEFNEYFPPRKTWHRFRRRDRRGKSSEELSFDALHCAVRSLRGADPAPPWAMKLHALVEQIRTSALAASGHQFRPPKITAQLKSGVDYRPIASFSEIIDKIVDSLVARYLREQLDPAFEPCSVAFRARQPTGKLLDREAAIAAIFDFRVRHCGAPLYVAECDIRGFFDCVSHPVVLSQLARVIDVACSRARLADMVIDPRARRTVEHYLACYSFSGSVKGDEAALRARERNPAANYKWPSSGPNSLADFYPDPLGRRDIGVPQGGAISCLISNLLLDFADKEVQLASHRIGCDVMYFRYCDDMIIISPDRTAAHYVFDAYLGALRVLKLPCHPPEDWRVYGIGFYERSKTKAPYVWHGRTWFNHSPWIQFLGYQIRYDGLLRVRKKSIDKHKQRLQEVFREVADNVGPEDSRVNRERLLYRLQQKLIALAVGRITLFEPINGPRPMCWSSGFRALHNRPFVGHHLRTFDRLRGAKKRELGRATAVLALEDRTVPEERQRFKAGLDYHGKPFSYEGQFRNTGGRDLILAPYQPDAIDRVILRRCYECFKRGIAK